MKFTVLLGALLAVFSPVVETKCAKTLAEIASNGKVVWLADEVEKMIGNGLDVQDIVKFTPKFQQAIPELIQEAVSLVPIVKEMVTGQDFKEFVAERQKKLVNKVSAIKEALPRLRSEGFAITKAGTYGPRLQITQQQFQTGLDIYSGYLKHVDFSNC